MITNREAKIIRLFQKEPDTKFNPESGGETVVSCFGGERHIRYLFNILKLLVIYQISFQYLKIVSNIRCQKLRKTTTKLYH